MNVKERVESGRRARAALAYASLSAKDLESALNASEATIRRILDGTRKDTSPDDLWAIADACLLPREWFNADLTRLHEIVPAGQPTFGDRPALRQEMEQALEALVERVEQKAATAGATTPGPRKRARES